MVRSRTEEPKYKVAIKARENFGGIFHKTEWLATITSPDGGEVNVWAKSRSKLDQRIEERIERLRELASLGEEYEV